MASMAASVWCRKVASTGLRSVCREARCWYCTVIRAASVAAFAWTRPLAAWALGSLVWIMREGRVTKSGTNQFASSSVMVMNGSGAAPGVRTPHASFGTR